MQRQYWRNQVQFRNRRVDRIKSTFLNEKSYVLTKINLNI